MIGHRRASRFSFCGPAPRTAALLAICVLLASCDSSGPDISSISTQESLNQAAPLDIAQAIGAAETLAITVELRGSMVLPVVDTRETARADIVFDRASKTLYAELQASPGLTLDVHIHEGGADEVGAVVATLFAQEDIYTLGEGIVLTDRQSALLESGGLYIDVHTDSYADGLLRAQLTNASVEVAVAPQLHDIQAKVFTPTCSGCHTGLGQTLPGLLDLTSVERSHESLVGVFSINEPSLLRVEPANPADSLLLRKLEGTQEIGSRMPFRGRKLNDQTIDAVRGWIARGAVR